MIAHRPFRTLALTVAATVSMLGTSALLADEPSGGNPTPTGEQLRQQFFQQQALCRQSIDDTLATESVDFKSLLEKPDKSFEDMRALAELRLELLKTSTAAQTMQATMETARAQFTAAHPELLGPPERGNRPVLTDAQKQELAAHREQLQTKERTLDALLQQLNAEYAVLLAKADKTPEEVRALLELRRQLIAGSPEAQALMEEIQTAIRTFREEHPFMARLGRPQGQDLVEKVRNEVQVIRTLTEQVAEMLRETSPEYAALLAKENKTAADMATLEQMRKQLIAANPDIQKLVELREVVKNRLQRPNRPDRPERPTVPRPGAATGGNSATPSK